jgi:transcriptional regulator with XRE-family HTH domain
MMNNSRTPQEEDLLNQFGEWLRLIRKRAGLSQEDLAAKAGFSRSYYTEIETGKRNISLLNLHRLATSLDINPADLLLFQNPQKEIQPRIPLSSGFINEAVLTAAGLTFEIVKGSMAYSYDVLDAIDQTLLTGNASRVAQMVELANLTSILGNLLGSGVARASLGKFERNTPHKYPDLLARTSDAKDIEIKTALENNKPKGHLAKAGYYLTFRYVLCTSEGMFTYGNAHRGDVVYIWEVRFGYLDLHHFSISNTAGDSGKTAVINAQGMDNLNVIYCDLDRCPYSSKSKIYKDYEQLFV